MKTSRLLLALALTLSCSPLVAETVKDREGAVRQDKAALEKDVRWIYNDFQRGLAEAQLKGKPLLVVLRCVPCLSCAGLDASVLQEPALAPLLEQFVCVRVINANALDLSLFQFDYDLSFSTLFFNGDGTVYGRFGSWTHQQNPQDKATTGYQRALEAALAVHRGYPANKPALAGKQGGPTPFKTAVEIPALAAKYKLTLDWDGKVVPSCVHCHQIGDAMRASYRTQKKPMPVELIFPMPMPETIGLTLAADHIARVTAVAAGSIAAKGGLQSDDELISLAGQPLISVADVSWVLHRAPASGSLSAVVKRAGREQALTLILPADWREQADISKRVGTWSLRGMAGGGLILEDLSDEDRAQRGLAKDAMALLVKGVGQYGIHGAAKNAGFQKEDVLLELDGVKERMSESQLLGRLLLTRQAGEKVKATVLRGADRTGLTLPMQ